MDIRGLKRVSIFAGHYGSGKTNIAVNYALHLREHFDRVDIADLDIVNPYFRTKDSEAFLESKGIHLISSEYANSNVDVPALPAEAYAIIDDESVQAVIDVGGDDRGALALGRYTPSILEENNYRMVFVANCYRPLTPTAEDALQIMREIEAACGLRFTCIVNNANLGPETTVETVTDSLDFIKKLCQLSGLPLWCHSAERNVAAQLPPMDAPVLSMDLQSKIFDLS